MSPVALPAGWRCAMNDAGKRYYYNKETKQTQWKPPCDAETPSRSSSASPSAGEHSPSGTHSPSGMAPQTASGVLAGSIMRPRDPSKWVCRTCTVENHADATVCTLCGSMQDDWMCQSCTLLNHQKENTCSACGTKRGTVEKGQGYCGRCTYAENKARWTHCDICGLASDGHVDDLPASSDTQVHGIPFEEQRRTWLGRVAEIEHSTDRFIDETFPPTLQTIYGNEMESLGPSDTGNIQEWKKYNELRGGRFHGGGARGWLLTTKDSRGGPTFSADVITQGRLGDCWFLSAVAVICTRQELIRNIFISTELSRAGVYALRFWHNGVWTAVLVDDFLPSSNGRIAFASGKGNILWPSLIEKAYAKLHGSYRAICSGTAGDALTDLTGAPCSKLKLSDGDTDMVWTELLSCHSSGCLMAASCGNRDSSKEAYKALGLVTNHCYTVLDVNDSLGVRLVKLRNPWGEECWRGDWGKDSHLWNDHNKHVLGAAQDTCEGTFWMAFHDFVAYFDCVDVCKTHENWYPLSAAGWFSRNASASGTAQFSDAYVMTTTAPTWAFVSVVQRDQRGAEASYNYTDAALVVVRVTKATQYILDPQNFEFVACVTNSVQRITTCEVILNTPGVYIVFPFSLQNINTDRSFTLALWCSKKVTMRTEKMQNLHPCTAALHKVFGAPSMAPKVRVMTPFASTKVVYLQGPHCVWFLAENMTNQTLYVKLDCSESQGVVSARGLLTTDTIPAGGRMLLMMLTSIQQYGGWVWRCKQSYQLGRIAPQHSPPLPSAAHLHDALYDMRGLQMFR